MRRVLPLVMVLLVGTAACSDGGDGAAAEGSMASDLLAGGSALFSGSCKVCHGASGGGGVGPPLDTLSGTFPDCEEQVRWIALGSAGWEEEVGPTYGAGGTEVGGGMPSFADSLTEAEIRLVAAWERSAIAGEDPSAAAEACGVPVP